MMLHVKYSQVLELLSKNQATEGGPLFEMFKSGDKGIEKI